MMDIHSETANDNPFASPSVVEPLSAAYEELLVPNSTPLPTALVWAELLLAVEYGLWMVVVLIRSDGLDLLALFLLAVPAGLLLPAVIGVSNRGRFAYRYLKFGAIVFAPIAITISAGVIFLIAGTRREPLSNGDWFGIVGLLTFTIASIGTMIALDRRSVREYVGLKCPRCGTFRTYAADFQFTTAKCKKCRVMW